MATNTLENDKLIKDLHALLLSGKEVNKNALKNIGIETTLKTQQFRNVKITNDFLNGLTVSVLDNQKDLDGNLISENKKLISRVKNLFENGTKKINTSELTELNIWDPAKEIILGNLMLSSPDFLDSLFSSSNYYNIQLIDENKNIDGLWIDSVITKDKILEVLHKFDLTIKQLSQMKEMDINKELELHFKKYFETVKKGGRSNQGDIDLILGSKHNYGIELKLAKELSKASASQKAIGQIELYTRQFKGNFMLIVIGLSTEKNEKSVAEVVRKAKDCKCTYYYLEAN
ncbi:MAG TPA: hypothetical protein VGQ09_03090 [Chitinophagaceae bacterium]|jgi:hypothetical protein|nr:hypothetical protein [Chitinophagaceae bacterium]